MSAHIFKLSAENQARTQKIQNTGRAVTTGIYRGVPGCGPQNYTTILYPIKTYGSGCYKLIHGVLPRICFR
jgi:hypothetical protein